MEGMEIKNVLKRNEHSDYISSELNCLTFDLACWIRRALSETLKDTS